MTLKLAGAMLTPERGSVGSADEISQFMLWQYRARKAEGQCQIRDYWGTQCVMHQFALRITVEYRGSFVTSQIRSPDRRLPIDAVEASAG